MSLKQEKIIFYKNKGETPLEAINRFKSENPEYKDEKMTYAGRLDPLAEGLLLLLVGEECKNKEKYLGLDKEYEVDVLFGFATDTYDILGVIKSKVESYKVDLNKIQKILQSFVGQFSQKYPAYSSKYFNKAKSGELEEDEIESKDVEIKNIEFINKKVISKVELEENIKKSISLVNGDFRQKEILDIWDNELQNSKIKKFQIVTIRVSCTSGTYMRTLANAIGEKIRISALALNIKRVKIGNYTIENK